MRLLWLTVFRTVVGALLLALLGFQVHSRVDLLETSDYMSFALLGMVFVVTLVTGLLLRAGRVPQEALWVHVLFDVTLSTAVVLLTGRGDSPFVFLYLVAIIGASILLGRRGGFAAFAISFISLVLITTRPWQPGVVQWRVFDLTVAGVAQVLVAVLSSYVSEQLTRSNTRLSESREDLTRLAELQREIVTAMPSGLMTCDERGHATYVNPAAQAILGADVTDTLVEQLIASLPPTGQLRRVERVVKTFRGERILGLSRAPLANETGATLIVFQDLTELRRLESELKRIDHLASLGRVSAQLAHEVRNPLAAMRGAAQMLETDADPQQAKLSKLIIREADRLAALVDGYLQLARPPPPSRQRVQLDQLVRETLEMLKADPSFPQVETALSACEIDADAGQLKQVMINLLRNAATATAARADGRIKVSTQIDADQVTVSVWDSAGSIREDDIERIFEPFFSRSAGGTGLGLSTVRTIVHGHGGQVALRSNPTDGTTFSVALPKAR